MSRWHAVWGAITRNRLSLTAAGVFVIAVVVVVERVMDHGYRFGAQWGPDKRFELAPAPTAAASASMAP